MPEPKEVYTKRDMIQRKIDSHKANKADAQEDGESLSKLAKLYRAKLSWLVDPGLTNLSDMAFPDAQELISISEDILHRHSSETCLSDLDFMVLIDNINSLVPIAIILCEAQLFPVSRKIANSSRKLHQQLKKILLDEDEPRAKKVSGHIPDQYVRKLIIEKSLPKLDTNLVEIERELAKHVEYVADSLPTDEDRVSSRRAPEMQASNTPDAEHLRPLQWSIVEDKLNDLVSQIAVRIVNASTLVANTPYSDRFQEWLVRKLDAAISEAKDQESSASDGASFDTSEVDAARRRGREMQKEIFGLEDMVEEDALPQEYGTSKKAALLALPHPERNGEFVYPGWQFDQKIFWLMPELLKILEPLTPWAKWHFFCTSLPLLLELTPLEALGVVDIEHDLKGAKERVSSIEQSDEGTIAVVMRAAEDYVRGCD